MQRTKFIRFGWGTKNMLRNKADSAVFEYIISMLVGGKVTIVELLLTVLYILPFFIIAIFFGCQGHGYERTLMQVDSVMERSPDSAYNLLLPLRDRILPSDESSYAKYTLLYTQACYKLYKPVPADSLIKRAVGYYEKSDDKSMLCRAYYYRAMTLYERNQHEAALRILKKGESIAKEINDVLQMSKYHESLCMVNYNANCHELMLEYAKLFLEDAVMLNDTALISRGLSHISGAYLRIGKQQEAKNYLMMIHPMLDNLDSSERSYILANTACQYHREGNLEKAKKLLYLSLKYKPYPHIYGELGDIFAEEGNWKEAHINWDQAMRTDNAKTKILVLRAMVNRYVHYKDYISAYKVLEQLSSLKDSVNRNAEKKEILKIQLQYDFQVSENRHNKILIRSLIAIIILLIVIIGYVIIHKRSIEQYTNLLLIKETAILHAKQRIEALESEGKDNSNEISQLRAKIENLNRQTNEDLGRGKEIYERILSGGKLTATDKESYLIEYYSVFQYEKYKEWMYEYKDLTARLITFLILQDMGKTDEQIEEILSISHGALRTTKSRINKKKRKN